MSRVFNICLAVGRLYSGIRGLLAIGVWLLLGGGGALIMAAFGGPWALILVVGLVGTVAFFFFLGLPARNGIFTPRYLGWYALSLRRISWQFENYLGLFSQDGQEPSISSLQFDLTVNIGGDLKPIDGFVISQNTGQRIAVSLKGQEGYIPIASIETIPKGERIHGQAKFADGPLPANEFLRRYSGFTFRFEFVDGVFERSFSRSELEFVIDGFRRHSNPPPARRIVRKTDT